MRERAGLTQKELGDRLGYGEDLISSLERGRRAPQPELLDAADEVLDAGGLLKATKEDVARRTACTPCATSTPRSSWTAGENIKALAEYLLHYDPGPTLRVYAHLMPSRSEHTRKAVASVWD
ncbi:helix-turn-helix domain-containing protein [Streptomyces sp. NPDC002730]|uniref:helix-turn-helix domain-containing protein n=1 Tax=Streptomyces sp. NPDC002730 TaxID=3364662 RepID=UPI003679C797